MINKEEVEEIIENSLFKKKSIQIIRHLFNENYNEEHVAGLNGVSSAYVRVVGSRFKNKIKAYRLKKFMEKEKPKERFKLLEAYSHEIKTLLDNGYTKGQIFDMIKGEEKQFTLNDIERYIQSLTRNNQ